jgi:hypothetical protein
MRLPQLTIVNRARRQKRGYAGERKKAREG